MARIGNDNDGCAVTEFIPDFVHHRPGLERIVGSLKVKQRDIAG